MLLLYSKKNVFFHGLLRFINETIKSPSGFVLHCRISNFFHNNIFNNERKDRQITRKKHRKINNKTTIFTKQTADDKKSIGAAAIGDGLGIL